MARRSNPDQNPTLRGRRLAMELQRRREATDMSREEVARQLEWSTSTLFRIETGRNRPQPGNVRILLELYGVTGAERDGLIQLTREARQPGWWHSFRDVLPNPYEVYIGLEAGAASICNFEPVVVPGLLQTEEVPLQGRSQAIYYRRDARLLKGQTARVTMQMMLPQIPRELLLELLRPDGIRADEAWKAPLNTLEPYQMLIVVLTRGSSDGYAAWNRTPAFTPTSVDLSQSTTSEPHRYYRLVLPMDPQRPLLSPHPLTWTTISHVIWDGMPPETLASAQQEAMLDWLHWGGQIILVGGATPGVALNGQTVSGRRSRGNQGGLTAEWPTPSSRT